MPACHGLDLLHQGPAKVNFVHLHAKMKPISKALSMLLASVVTAFATPSERLLPIVDLGYARYQGYYDSTFGLHVWKGWVVVPQYLCITTYN